MTYQPTPPEPVSTQATGPAPRRGNPAHSWWWLFLLLTLWVFGIRTGSLAFLHAEVYVTIIPPMNMERLANLTPEEFEALLEDTAAMKRLNKYFEELEPFLQMEYAAMLEDIATRAGILLYLMQLLGIAVLPAMLAKGGVFDDSRVEKRLTIALLALSVAFLPVFLFTRGLLARPAALYALFALFTLCPSVALGIVLRRGAMYWQEGKVALYVGLAFVLDHVFTQLQYYSWIATENPVLYLGYSYAFFAGLLIAAGILRLRGEDAPSLPPASHVYPSHFPRNVGLLIAAQTVISSAINTVIYFDNMEDFHTPGYELFFYILAFFVMLGAMFLYYRRRWLAPTLIGLLLVCFGQGLSLFGIESLRLAITYNLVTMIGKVPLLLVTMIIPLYYAVGTRRPGLACLGLAIPAGADFLMNLTQITETGIGGVLRGQMRQGVLLLAELCVIGALFYLYTRFERTRTNALLQSIQAGRRERKSTQETVDGLDLTAREKEVTALLLNGDSQKIIAAKLNVSFSTVSFHIRNLYRKLNIQSKGELFALFLAEEPSDIA